MHKNLALGYITLRLILGASFTFHGVNRFVVAIGAFQTMMVGRFE